jgi:hypothetical protein
MRATSEDIGFLAPASVHRFRSARRSSFARRPPSLAKWVHPPVSFRSPAECCQHVLAPSLQYDEAPSLGFRPSSRHQPAAALMRDSQVPHRSVHDVSHVLDGLLRHRPCGFISPRSHVQGSLFRGFPPGAAVPPRRRPVPSWRWLRLAAPRLPAVRHAPLPAFRACSTPGSVAPPAGFSRERRPIPS